MCGNVVKNAIIRKIYAFFIPLQPMNLMISEVQITCVILMGLFTLCLTIAIPLFTIVGKTFNVARKILAGGTFLVMVHFIVQYMLHKHDVGDLALVRSLVNLSFGIPLSYLFNMSNHYLQCKGKVSLVRWLLSPVFFIMAMVVVLIGYWVGHLEFSVLIMSVFYAITLLYYAVVQIKSYLDIRHSIRTKSDLSQTDFIKWTQWSMLAMVILPLGFPLMTFCTSLIMRSLYGLLAISSAFFYVFCFIGYGITGSATLLVQKRVEPQLVEDEEDTSQITGQEEVVARKEIHSLDESKMERMKLLVKEFEDKESFLRSGITLKEVASEMGISSNMLRTWLHTTKYDKFSTWIIVLRLQKAKKLLIHNPELGNDAIAESCGFCDRQYFQLQFRKHEGMTPSRWVKENYNAKE